MVLFPPTEVNAAAVGVDMRPCIATNKIQTRAEFASVRMSRKLAIIKEEPDIDNLDEVYEDPSLSTSMQSLTPRSSLSTHSGEDELVVVFESKCDYMHQESFDKTMRKHGIEEEVSHRISRVETNVGKSLPDAQWDDPCSQFFPVRCFYRKLTIDSPPSAPANSPSSQSTAMQLADPRLSLSLRKGEDELVVIFDVKDDYMNQETFDRIMCAHGIEEEVSHRISRIETNIGEPLPDAQWDDPCLDCFPVWCFYRRLVKESTSLSPANVLSTTPLATAPKIPTLNREGRATVPSHCLATNPAPTCPHRSPIETIPTPFRVSSRNESVISSVSVPYQVKESRGINLRIGPHLDAAPTGVTLLMDEIFHVSESVFGTDGWRHLKLANGFGWVPAEAVRAQERQSIYPSDPSFSGQSKGKSKAKHAKTHVPCWAQCHRPELVRLPPGLGGLSR